MPTDGVNFIDKDDARRAALCRGKQIADARCTHPDENFDELRPANRKKGNVRFARDGARHQRLAGAWRSDEEHASWNARTERGELVRLFQKLDDLLQLLLRFIYAGDVRKGDGRFIACKDACPRFAKRERRVIAALRAP